MNPFIDAVNTVHILINILVLWFVWHVLWRRSCQESYRQGLFEVRDELFDFARSGGVSFDDPAYVAIRSYINSMIRFSHVISVTRLATFIVFERYIGESPMSHQQSVNSALSQVRGRATKETLTAVTNKIRAHTENHVWFASPQILFAGPLLLLLESIISKKPNLKVNPEQPAAVFLIEIQAREAYRSEALKRRHASELAAVES